jgi:hypothetical protein
MKRIGLTLLAVVVVLGLFAAVGYAGYRLGYVQSAQRTVNDQAPELRPFDGLDSRGMPGHNFGFERGFQRGFGMLGFPMMGFGFFSLFGLLAHIALLALLLGLAYWLFTRSGWRLARTVQTVQTTEPPRQTTETEIIEEQQS